VRADRLLPTAPALALGLAAAVLGAMGAAAQRPRCGFGEALAALGAAEPLLARPPAGLSTGREQAMAAADRLRAAAVVLQGCACRRAAEDAAEAASLAEAAGLGDSAARIGAMLERAGFSVRLVRERLGGQGCS
jgi:hypothetical protein